MAAPDSEPTHGSRWRSVRSRWLWALPAVAAAAVIFGVALPGGPGPRGRARAAGPARSAGPRPRPRPRFGNGDASVRHVLGYTSYVALGSRRRREVALTFDDGPGPFTSRVLALLERRHVPATFFVIGRQVHLFAGLIAREQRDGDAIGDHTEDHPALAALSPGAQRAEIGAAASQIEAAGGAAPVLFRPPYGSFDSATMRILRGRRMLMVLWSVDTRDFAQPGVGQIVRAALAGAHSGAIVLMHDGGGPRGETVAALSRIVHDLRRRRFHLVTVTRLVRQDPPPHHQRPVGTLVGG